MTTVTQRITASILLLLFLLPSELFAQNESETNRIDVLVEAARELQTEQQEKQEKYATIVEKAETIIESYQETVEQKSESYQRRNKQNIESTLKKAKQTKLKLLDLANQKLESDKQDHLEAEIVSGNISQQEAQLIEQVLPTEFLFELQGSPNDALYDNQWGLQNILPEQTQNNLTYSGEKITVAVIDTGVDFSQSDLAGTQWTSENCLDANGNQIPGG
ncbi:hypothetical protein MK079_05055, partial [Candidatus Gracilibacteria bacterium]|nr:hypothetical protein [Candidatus Gracilibacteria bacterium]